MLNRLVFVYGEDFYDHDNRVRTYHEEQCSDEPNYLKEQIAHVTKQMYDLFKRKRFAWMMGYRVQLDVNGSEYTEIFREAHPLKERIVLNAEAEVSKAEAMNKALNDLNVWANIQPVQAVNAPVHVWINEDVPQEEGFL